MARYLILDRDNKVVNSIEWNGDTNRWNPPVNHTFLLSQKGNIGDIFDGRNFITPPRIPSEDEIRQTEFKSEIIAIDDDPTTTGTFQRWITAIRSKLGF